MPDGYPQLLDALKTRIKEARVRTATSVNSELIALYWQIGQEILPYDVAIVDWTMPGISGRDVVQAIQKSSPTTRIIVATGQMDISGAGLNPQEIAVLRKPFTLRSLAGTLSGVMERSPGQGPSA